MSLIFSCAAYATELKTADGFAIRFNDDGRVSRIAIGETELPLTKPGGFSLADFKAAPQPRNLVVDGGFEDVARPLGLANHQRVDTTVKRAGRRSIQIEIPRDSPDSSAVTVTAAVRPGRRYAVGMWVRRRGVKTCGAFAVEKDNSGKPSGLALQTQQAVPNQDDRWLPIQWEVLTAKNTSKLEVRVTIWKSHGTIWVDDFFVHEVDEGQFSSVAGSITSADNGVTFESDPCESGLAVTATYRIQASCIRIDGELADTTGRDRSIALRFSLPLNATGWTWHHDTEEFEVVQPDNVLRRTYRCRSGIGECSIYPWASLSKPDVGLSFALPMDDGPRVFVLQHDARDNESSLTFFFGLTPETSHFPSRARFSILLFRHDPAWGMRSTIERYSKLFPHVFAKRMPHEAYLNYADLERFDPQTHELVVNNTHRLPDASDFGEGYVRVSSIHGCYQYIQTTLADPTTKPSDDEVLKLLDEMVSAANPSASRYLPLSEVVKKLVFGPRGELCYIGDTRFFEANEGYNRTPHPGWGLNFRVNEDPDVSPVLAARSWDAAAKHTKSSLRRPWDAAFTADAIEGYLSNSNCLNYRREHFASVSFPLTFGATTRTPAISNSIYDFLAEAWWPISAKGKIAIYGNSNSYEQVFTAGLIDLPMMESNWDVRHPGRLDRYFRAIHGSKLCRFWRAWDEQGQYGEQDPENVRRHFDRGLAYAFFPSVYGVCGREGRLERHRHAYRTYVPAIEELSRAGWQPVPHARASGGVVVERFGNASRDDLHFTLRNDSDAALETDLVIDTTALGLPDGDGIVGIDLLSGPQAPLEYQDGQVRLTVPAFGTRAVWLGSRPQAARHGYHLAAALLEKYSRLFDAELAPGPRRLLESAQRTIDRGRSADPRLALALTAEADAAITRLGTETKTAAPIDRDKLLARIRAAVSWASLALVDIRLETAPGIPTVQRGEVFRQDLNFTAGPAVSAVTSSAVTSIVTDVDVRARASSRAGTITIHLAAIIPDRPARALLPLLVELCGTHDGQDFMIAVPYDVLVEEHASLD